MAKEEKEREHAAGIYPQQNHIYDEESELKQAEIEAIDEVSQTKIQQILHEKMTDYRTSSNMSGMRTGILKLF